MVLEAPARVVNALPPLGKEIATPGTEGLFHMRVVWRVVRALGCLNVLNIELDVQNHKISRAQYVPRRAAEVRAIRRIRDVSNSTIPHRNICTTMKAIHVGKAFQPKSRTVDQLDAAPDINLS